MVVFVVSPVDKNGCVSVNFGRTSSPTCSVKRCANWRAFQHEMKPCNSLIAIYGLLFSKGIAGTTRSAHCKTYSLTFRLTSHDKVQFDVWHCIFRPPCWTVERQWLVRVWLYFVSRFMYTKFIYAIMEYRKSPLRYNSPHSRQPRILKILSRNHVTHYVPPCPCDDVTSWRCIIHITTFCTNEPPPFKPGHMTVPCGYLTACQAFTPF
jgi:hypothetical protein